jgi:hypothetical protein
LQRTTAIGQQVLLLRLLRHLLLLLRVLPVLLAAERSYETKQVKGFKRGWIL